MSEPMADRHSDEEYLDAVREHQPAATSEIADAVGVARQSADYRLRRLADAGQVSKERIGNSIAWSLADLAPDPSPVDPNDAFWEAETYVGVPMSAGDVDDVVYDDRATE